MHAQNIARFFKEHHMPHKVLVELQQEVNGKGQTSSPVLGNETRWGSWLRCLLWNKVNLPILQVMVSTAAWYYSGCITSCVANYIIHYLCVWQRTLLEAKVKEACSIGLSRDRYQNVYRHVVARYQQWERKLGDVIQVLQALVSGIMILQGDSPNLAAVYPL